ncbi:MAG: M3 family metallopeptidase [Trueperaceae bacterium]|nr:M3 family metallopeptidase [Trueperaceae bacterium]
MHDHTDNPLRARDQRPPFASMRADHVVPAVDAAIAEAQAALDALVARSGARTYHDTVAALDDLVERVGRVYRYAQHLSAVRSTPELRTAFADAQGRFQRFTSRLDTHQGLYRTLRAYAASDDAERLDPLRARHLQKTLHSMRRAGADLPPDERTRVETLRVELAHASTRFKENVLDATNAFSHLVTDEAFLAGLPATAREAARRRAHDRGERGWRFTLQAPSLLAVATHAEHRPLREALIRAHEWRAADGAFDNRPLVREILAKRRELARALGYPTYAHYMLEDRMVGDVDGAVEFVRELERRTRPSFEREADDVRAFAREHLGIDPLESWDVRFAFERLRRARFDVDEETLRSYFALPEVERGMFELARRLFGLTFEAVDAPERWHDDVTCFRVRDEAGVLVGIFYADWFPRDDKVGGAWMNPLILGGPRPDGHFDPHVGVMCGNLTPGIGDAEALLSLDEVQTLFHEFGHLLHLLCTQVEIRARGSFAAAWDFVELPSQIMENWTYESDALALFARHVETGATIPDELVEKVRAARHFQAAWSQMSQLSYAGVDLALHVDFDPERDDDPVTFAQRAAEPFQLDPRFARTGFVCAFTHVFAGGYAAGYYSYKWAEVLDADAFGRFADGRLFDRETGRAFVDSVLSRGDAADAIDLFRDFMGRDPDVEALIARNLGGAPAAGGAATD